MAEQCIQALGRANEVRLARVELKAAIKGGDVLLAEVLLADLPDWLSNMRAEDLAACVRRLRRSTWHGWMYRAGAGLGARVGGLTDRQRGIIGRELAEWEAACRERQERRVAA
jgi:hypothetical protein